MGIKGASVLFLHSLFKIAKGVAIDSLHTLFLGVVKTQGIGSINPTKAAAPVFIQR